MDSSTIGFLPGTSGHGSFWDPIRERLRSDIPTWTINWPGLGGNAPDPLVGSFEDLVAWTARMVERRSVLVGQSMGGYVAMRLAIEHPEPLDARISSVEVPTLLLWATDDPISPLPLGERLASLLPSAELIVYQSDDHWVVLEQAADVAARIDRLVVSI